MAEEEAKEKLEPLNARIPSSVLIDVRKSANALGIKLQKFSAFSLKLGLFFLRELGWQEGGEVAEETFAVLCLKTGKNALEKRGINTEKLEVFITEVETLLKVKTE